MKKTAVVILAIIILMFAAGCNKNQDVKAVGEVNDMKISQTEYDQRIKLMESSYIMQQKYMYGETDKNTPIEIPEDVRKQIEDQAFENLVYQKLLVAEAENRDIEVGKDEIEQSLEQFKAMQMTVGEDAYVKFLADTSLSEDKLKEEMRMEQIVGKLQQEVTKNVKVTEEEAQAYYEERKEMFKQPAGVAISHILVETEEEAVDIINRINAGEDFAAMAKENSTCPSSASGGNLGVVNEDTGFDQTFKDAALALSPGEMTQKPVKTQFGYHIIKAGERQEESIQEFEDVKNQIIINMQQQKEVTTFNDFVEDLYKHADIKDFREKADGKEQNPDDKVDTDELNTDDAAGNNDSAEE